MSEKLKVHIFMPSGAEPDVSPYGVKLLAFLRASKIEYEIVQFKDHQLKNSPKKKCPYVQRSDINGGKELGDSAVIMKTLVDMGEAPDFDAHLSENDKLVSTAFRALFEDNLYWNALWVKWATDQYDKHTYGLFFKDVPWLLRPVVAFMVQRETANATHAQGTGRHSEAEIISFTTEKIKTVSAFLGKKKYMMGDKMSCLDFTAFGMLSNFASPPWEHPVLETVRQDKNLMDYVERMRSELLPDFVGAGSEEKKES